MLYKFAKRCKYRLCTRFFAKAKASASGCKTLEKIATRRLHVTRLQRRRRPAAGTIHAGFTRSSRGLASLGLRRIRATRRGLAGRLPVLTSFRAISERSPRLRPSGTLPPSLLEERAATALTRNSHFVARRPGSSDRQLSGATAPQQLITKAKRNHQQDVRAAQRRRPDRLTTSFSTARPPAPPAQEARPRRRGATRPAGAEKREQPLRRREAARGSFDGQRN